MKEKTKKEIRVKSEKDLEKIMSMYGDVDVTVQETGEEVNVVDFLHLYDGQDVIVTFDHEYDYDCLSHIFSI